MTHTRPCTATDCDTNTSSSTGRCWQHRPTPPITRNGNRIAIGTALTLTPEAARALTIELADALLADN